MRIAMLSYHTCPLAILGGKDTGGMNVYVRDLTRTLGTYGIGVDVFTRSQDEHVPHVLHDLGYGNRVVHIPAGPEVPLARDVLASHLPEFVEGILSFQNAKGLHYDLLHSHYWLSGLAALQLQARLDIPVIQMFHTLGATKGTIARAAHEIPSALRLESERELLRTVNLVISSTEAEVGEIHRFYGEETAPIEIIPPGVDTSHFYPIDADEGRAFVGIPCDQKMLLFVGRIEPLKGIDALIKAVAILKQDGFLDEERFCMVIIGGDPDASEEDMSEEMNRLMALREENGLQDLVIFLGKRAQDSLPYYYSAATAVIVPSHYESFGLVALEAMACGTPVIATATGGLAYLVRDGETGFQVPVGQPGELADRIKRLLRDDTLRERMGEAAQTYAGSFSWPRIVERIIPLYRDVINDYREQRRSETPS